MTPGLSLYLDALRITAAFMVFLNHAGYARVYGNWLGPWARYGHDAVIIFFVLSGFVISWVTTTRNRGPVEYAVARLARLWSVVLPALVLGAILDHYGSQFDPKIYDGWWYAKDQPALRLFANSFFLAEIWTWGVRAFSNGPMWSVQYEFWYYAIFAAWFFPRRRAWKIAATLVAMAIAGPAILLLLPCWLAGVLVYKLVTSERKVPPVVGLVLFAASIAAYVVYREYGLKDSWEKWSIDLLSGPCQQYLGVGWVHLARYARSFLSDYLLTVIVAAHFVGAHAIAPWAEPLLKKVERPIRWAAGYTFVLYLMHYPLLHFYASTTKRSGIIMLMVLQTILLLGVVTEQAKGRYKAALLWLVHLVAPARRTSEAASSMEGGAPSADEGSVTAAAATEDAS